MEFRSSFWPSFFVFLLLALSRFSRGGSSEVLDTEMYEIDYRGPETHSSVPPPAGNSYGEYLPTHRKTSIGKPKTTAFFTNTEHNQEKVKKIHG